MLDNFGSTQHKWMPCHVCQGRKSGETLEQLYKAADTAQAQSLSRKSVIQQTKNDNSGRKVLAGLKIDSKMI